MRKIKDKEGIEAARDILIFFVLLGAMIWLILLVARGI